MGVLGVKGRGAGEDLTADAVVGVGQLRQLEQLGFVESVLLEPCDEEVVEYCPFIEYLLF